MASTLLRDGSTAEDPRLDWLYEEDWESLNFLVGATLSNGTPVAEKKPRSFSYRLDLRLDQGEEGACVSTGCGHELAARPAVVSGVTFPWCRENIYHPAQHEDPWDGCHLGPRCPIAPSDEAYEGTSTLAGVKQLQRLGFITGYTWAVTLKEAVLGLGYKGPGIVGVIWTEGMFDTDADGYIHPTGRVMGGHCLLAQGVKLFFRPGTVWKERTWADVDLDRSYIVLHNSWGPGWGVNGRAKISLRDFEYLLNQRGDMAFVQRTRKRSVAA